MNQPTQNGGAAAALELRCGRCGQRNRVLRARLVQQPRCGACAGPIFPGVPVAASDATFDEEALRSPLPVLVDLWAPWCGPCRAIAPLLDRIAAERAGKLKVVKVDVDASPRTAARFGVQAVPTLLLVKDGRVVETLRGAPSKAALDAQLDRFV